MDQKARRAAVAKAFRAQKVSLRKGHWTIPADEVTWWIDLRADSPRPDATLNFEIGAWIEGAGPQPEGGANDCPLLVDQELGLEPAAETEALVARLRSVTSRAELAAMDLTDAHLDSALRNLLGR